MKMNNKSRKQHFLKRAKSLHHNKFDYSNVIYVNAKTPVEIICKVHGSFHQTPDQHLRVYNISKHKNTGGCPQCAHLSRKQTKRKTTEQFKSDCRRIHGFKYDYSLVEYTNTHAKVTLICPIHGRFKITPSDHIINKQGCRQCVGNQHSGIALRWLIAVENKHNIQLQRIGRGGEYRIPGTKLHVDGYHESTNTIYEFYGDNYHGNPRRFKPRQKCHPFNKTITAGQLYKNTMKRESYLRSLGYKLVTIWEQEYRSQE